jgi:hypothetical protein
MLTNVVPHVRLVSTAGNQAKPKRRYKKMPEVMERTKKEPTPTGNSVKVGESVELAEYSDTLSFTVPSENLKEEYKDKAGDKVDYSFTYPVVQNDEEAQEVCAVKGIGWSLADFVNDALKSAARSAAYQRLTAQYKESEMSPDEARLRLIRAFQRQGVPEEFAAKMVDETLANKR